MHTAGEYVTAMEDEASVLLITEENDGAIEAITFDLE